MTNTKKPKDTSHLEKYKWKPGYRPPGSGRKKGSRDRSTELTLQVLCDAALIDPETGKRMSAKALKKRLSRHIWSDARILLNYLDRKLGKPAEKVDQTVQFIIRNESYSLPPADTPPITVFALEDGKEESHVENDDESST